MERNSQCKIITAAWNIHLCFVDMNANHVICTIAKAVQGHEYHPPNQPLNAASTHILVSDSNHHLRMISRDRGTLLVLLILQSICSCVVKLELLKNFFSICLPQALNMRPSILTIQSSKSTSLRTRQVPYICASCRHQALGQGISHLQSTRNASSGLPWTERLRRKMWGTDNPPGLKDPYGGPGYFERRRQEAQAEQAERGRGQIPGPRQVPTEPTILEHESALSEPALPELSMLEDESAQNTKRPHTQDVMRSRSVPENDPEKEDLTYVPAETWNGLEQVGLSGHWSETPPTPADSFRP